MASNFNVLGPESSVVFYNLNKQFCNLKKLIITKEIIIDSFEGSNVRNVFNSLESAKSEDYTSLASDSLSVVSSADFNSDFYRKLQDSLESLYENLSEVKLKDYNFMNSVSNVKFTVVLRTPHSSFSKYYIEKGALLNSIRSLLKEHLKFELNSFNPSKVSTFHIEIFESFDVYKTIYLKKDSDSLILSSSFGFYKSNPADYQIGPELYYSRGEDFKFFNNSQATAVFRDHSKIDEVEINSQEKILQNDDLVLINNSTKNINDVLIEAVITRKGALKIINVSLLENQITYGNDNGFIINKSSKNYNRISLLTLRDNYYEDTPNPKYLLIRNQEEVNEINSQLSIIRYFDGIIFNSNFFSPYLDKIGTLLDIDIFYFRDKLQKGLDISINITDLSIEGAIAKSNDNPFSKILKEDNKERDEFLERLKSVDLSTPNTNNSNNPIRNSVSNIAEGIISSPNASTSKHRPTGSSNSSGMYSGLNSSSGGSGLSAIGMLAQSVLGNGAKPVREEPVQQMQQTTSDGYVSFENNQPEQQASNQNSAGFGDFFSQESQTSSNQQSSSQNTQSSNEGFSFDNMMSSNQEHSQSSSNVNTSSYDEVISTKIMTTPNISSGNYFVDINSLPEVSGSGEINLLVTSPDEIGNPEINYIMPVSIARGNSYSNCSLLINNPEDYFKASENAKGYFINLTQISSDIRKRFFKESLRRFNTVSLIMFKEDLDLIDDNVGRVKSVFIKNLSSDSELEEVKNRIKSFEKRALMKKELY